MTANFGCGEGRTMASQPSVHNEERNLLRLRAWEQRNQEASQAKELNPENVPLFGEPYKTNKGDELSNRIQKMLGSYENVNSPYPLTTEPLPIPSYVTFSQSDQGQPDADKSTRAPFHNQVHYTSAQAQKGPSSRSQSSQPVAMSAASSPHQHGHSSTHPTFSFNRGQGSRPGNLAHQQKKSEAFSDAGERNGLPQEMSAHSPDAKAQSLRHSNNDNGTATDTRDTFDGNQRPDSSDCPSESAMDVSTPNVKLSPKDASLTQATKTNALPLQTFPPLLSSKQSSIVMTQKPTAYVRPMDGQDQMVSESPELKPSPEPYVTLPELISKSNPGKMKILPPFMETRTNEAQCVEDILREMIHSWPPLLTAIHTPSVDEPSKSSFSAKEAELVSSRQGQLSYILSPLPDLPSPPLSPPAPAPSTLTQQSSSSSFEAAHSSGVESASSSDSESSSRSESDSESATGAEPPEPPVSSAVKTEPDAPAVSRGDWQLGNWIRSSQQNASTESQGGSALVSESPAHRRLLPTQSSKNSSVEGLDPARESKPRLPSRQRELGDEVAKPQQCKKSHQNNRYQQSHQISPTADFRKLSCKKISSKAEKGGCHDQTETAVSVKCEDVVDTRDKDVCITDRPKVKTKTRKKSKEGDSKQDGKRTSKNAPLDKRKLGPEPDVKPVPPGHCTSCGAKYPYPCSCPCPARSPAQPDQPSPGPPVRISCSRPKAEAISLKGSEKPRKTTRKRSEHTAPTAGGSQDLRPPRCLLVKIDLSLLSRVPHVAGNHQEVPGNAKRSAAPAEPGEGGGDAPAAHKQSKGSKKSKAPNVELDNKTLPRKKRRLENKNNSSAPASIKLESSSNLAEDREGKKAKKPPASATPKDAAKDSKSHKRCPAASSGDAAKGKDPSKHNRRGPKHTEHPQSVKQKPSKSCSSVPSSSSSSQSNKDVVLNRPLLRAEDRQYPVKHYIKEAKKLKHKADAESDKLTKAFNYLDAAMFFVESGIAMMKDPQISMSSYTMFEETVELLKFVLKLKNSVEPSAAPSEKDFLALCLKCQSLLQMTMFRHKHKTALKYSKTLTDHFTNSAQASHDPSSVCTAKAAHTPSPMPDAPSPANTSTSSGPGSNQSGSGSGGSAAFPAGGGMVAVPQAVAQVASSYVNITTLFVSAHDLWEQAALLANRGSGLLAALDTVMGPLSPTSTMSAMVRYTRQGVHWLRLDSRKVK